MTFYFDMDGVLAVYEPANPPDARPWLTPGAQFYATRRPDGPAIQLAAALSHDPRHSVKILTRVHDVPEMLAEWTDEKLSWLSRHASSVPSDDHDKSVALDGVSSDKRREHCLVDDDPAILDAWTRAGGSAVQYSSIARPHDPWDGPLVHGEMSLTDAIQVVQEVAKLADGEGARS